MDLRDGNINARKVIKDQINFKLNLGKIEKENKISKSKDQTSAIWNDQVFFHLRDYFFCYLKLNTKQNMEVVSEY